MKLHQQERVLESDGLKETSSFKIKATSKAFRILIDGLYSNKIEAILRELSSNAVDSHKAAGKEDVPIRVHLPTRLEPWFEVEDEGIGLSNKDIMNLYVTIFDTNKDDSNDFTGGLGLGSKSPFAYVNSFTVTSKFDGVKRVYGAYLNKEGQPHISLIHEEPTQDGNGMCIKMQTKAGDEEDFRDAAKRVYRRYKVLPKVSDPTFELEKVEYVLTNDSAGWRIRKRAIETYRTYNSGGSVDNRAMAIQGTVAYPLDVHSLGSNTPEQVRSILNLPVDIEFPIGQLDVSASRESLSYDDTTISNIIARCLKVHESMVKSIEQEFEDCPTLYEARLKHGKVRALFPHFGGGVFDDIMWRGKTIKPIMQWKYHADRLASWHPTPKAGVVHEIPMELSGYHLTNYNLRKTNIRLNNTETQRHSANPDNKVVYLYDDVVKGLGPHIKWLMESGNMWEDVDEIYVFRGDNMQGEILKLFDYLGGIPATDLAIRSTLPVKPRPTTANGRRYSSYVAVKKFVSRNGGYSYYKSHRKSDWQAADIVLEDGGIYVPLEGGDAEQEFYTAFRLAKDAGYDKIEDLYGIPAASRRKKFDKLLTDGAWVCYKDAMLKWVKGKLDARLQDVHDYIKQEQYIVPKSVVALYLTGKIRRKDSFVYRMMDGEETGLSDDDKANIKSWLALYGHLNDGPDEYAPKDLINKEEILQEAMNEYPLLEVFDMGDDHSSYRKPTWAVHKEKLVEYINMVDEMNAKGASK